MAADFEYRKLEELVLCIADSTDVGAVKLEKLLYLCDFIAAEKLGEPLTGEVYRHFENGPVAKHMKPVIADMTSKGYLRVDKTQLASGVPFVKFTPLRKCDEAIFSDAEKRIIDEVIAEFGRWSAKELIDYVHGDWTWKLTDRNEDIPYYLAPYRRYAKPTRVDAEAFSAREDYQERLRQALTNEASAA